MTVVNDNRRRAKRTRTQVRIVTLIVKGLDQALIEYLRARVFYTCRSGDYLATTLTEAGAVMLALATYQYHHHRQSWSVTVTCCSDVVIWTMSRSISGTI